MAEDNKYPLEPPYDDELTFIDTTVVRVLSFWFSWTLTASRERQRFVQSVHIPSISEWSHIPANTSSATSATKKRPSPVDSAAV